MSKIDKLKKNVEEYVESRKILLNVMEELFNTEDYKFLISEFNKYLPGTMITTDNELLLRFKDTPHFRKLNSALMDFLSKNHNFHMSALDLAFNDFIKVFPENGLCLFLGIGQGVGGEEDKDYFPDFVAALLKSTSSIVEDIRDKTLKQIPMPSNFPEKSKIFDMKGGNKTIH